MRFTIIVPIFNKEKYLRRCLDSVASQTSKNFECLLIDDGSTDGSNVICKEYEKKYDFFKLYKKENGGLSDARNFGIDKSSGDYLLFLDADDCIDSNLIYICDSVLKEHKADIIVFGMACVSEITDIGCEDQTLRLKENVDLIYDILCDMVGVSVCNKAYKRDLFTNQKFIKGRLFEDQFIILKLLKGKDVIAIDNTMYFYFQDVDDSLSKKSIYPETYDYLEAAIEIAKDASYEKKYLKIANKIVYERIVLLLTNVYYREGQFQNCNKKKIDKIIRKNLKLIMNGLELNKKALLLFYILMPDCIEKLIIRMRFRPILYLKGKMGLKQ